MRQDLPDGVGMRSAEEWLQAHAVGELTAKQDTKRGLSSSLLRGHVGDRYAIAVAGDAKVGTQVNALLDVLAWTHWEGDHSAPVLLVVDAGQHQASVLDALRTLRANVVSSRDVSVMVATPNGALRHQAW